MEFTKVGVEAFSALCIGTILAICVPLAIAIIWVVKKKENFSTILVGALTFLLFALIIEKPLQALIAMPTSMGLSDTPVSRFLSANPVLLCVVLGLFPGVFEETGRLVAFKTVLRNRKNKETAISYGIGHGGIEVVFILGISFVTYMVYAVMINTGTFATVVEQAAAAAPDQAQALKTIGTDLAGIKFTDILPGFGERIFAFLLHIGESILVFYACRDKEKFGLYPLAILIHSIVDFVAGLYQMKVINTPVWVIEIIVVLSGLLTFLGAYFLVYRKDDKDFSEVPEVMHETT